MMRMIQGRLQVKARRGSSLHISPHIQLSISSEYLPHISYHRPKIQTQNVNHFLLMIFDFINYLLFLNLHAMFVHIVIVCVSRFHISLNYISCQFFQPIPSVTTISISHIHLFFRFRFRNISSVNEQWASNNMADFWNLALLFFLSFFLLTSVTMLLKMLHFFLSYTNCINHMRSSSSKCIRKSQQQKNRFHVIFLHQDEIFVLMNFDKWVHLFWHLHIYFVCLLFRTSINRIEKIFTAGCDDSNVYAHALS